MTTFTHAEDCPDPDDTKLDAVMGRLGDPLLRCPSCRRFKVVKPEPAPPPSTGLVCREHLAPVTWRGTGCRSCDADRASRQRAREAASRDRRQAERDRERVR